MDMVGHGHGDLQWVATARQGPASGVCYCQSLLLLPRDPPPCQAPHTPVLKLPLGICCNPNRVITLTASVTQQAPHPDTGPIPHCPLLHCVL